MNILPAATAVLLGLLAGTPPSPSNIDAVQRYAWSENVGWTNWRHDTPNPNDGVLVDETFLSGFFWAENVGWISVGDGVPANGSQYANLDSSDFGVNLDPSTGDLSGLAWGENVGWINFETSEFAPNQARLDRGALRLRGYAWAENIGWINLDDTEHFVGVISLDPIPTVSEWGLVVMMLLTLTAGTLALIRKRLVPVHQRG